MLQGVPQALASMGLADLHVWGVFVVATAVLNATPGVDMLLTVTRTLQAGTRAGLATAVGIGAGCAVHAVAAAFGLAAVLAVSARAFEALKLLGMLYLLWTAWALFRVALGLQPLQKTDTSDSTPGATTSVASDSNPLGAEFRRGLFTNVLNPKVALFFLAFVPQFIAPDVPNKTGAFLVLGAAFVCQGTLFLWAVVALASRVRVMAIAPGVQRVFQGVAGAMFVAFAWRLWLARPLASVA